MNLHKVDCAIPVRTLIAYRVIPLSRIACLSRSVKVFFMLVIVPESLVLCQVPAPKYIRYCVLFVYLHVLAYLIHSTSLYIRLKDSILDTARTSRETAIVHTVGVPEHESLFPPTMRLTGPLGTTIVGRGQRVTEKQDRRDV